MSDKPTVLPIPTHIAAINESLNNVGKQFQKSMDSALGVERSALAELVPLAQSLNAESDDLNATIQTINRKIRALNLGVEVWVEGTDGLEVGFVRLLDEWQLAVRWDDVEPDLNNGRLIIDVKNHAPLLKRNRDERINGLELVPEILRKLKEDAQKKISAIKNAKALAASL
jgi:hypothetical protein